MSGPCLLYLFPVPDGHFRLPTYASHGHRTRWRLPRPPWVCRALQALGDRALKPDPLVLELRPHHTYDGLLHTCWGKDGFLLWEYYGRPRDAFTLLASPTSGHTSVPKDLPDAVETRIGRSFGQKSGNTLFILLAPIQVVFHDDQHVETMLGMHLPAPLVALLAAGYVSQIMWRHVWLRHKNTGQIVRDMFQHFCLNWPPQEWVDKLQELEPHALVPLPVQPKASEEAALYVAEVLRKHMAGILDSSPVEDHFDLCEHLSAVLQQLDLQSGLTQLSHSLPLEDCIPHQPWRARRPQAFKPEALLHALSLAMRLKNRGHLRTVVKKSLHLAGVHTENPDQLLQGLGKTPSSSVLSRSQVLIDMAWASFCKENLQRSTGPLYLWADSSPQAGEDYFLSTLMSIKCDKLVPSFVDAQFLVATTDTLAEYLSHGDLRSRGLRSLLDKRAAASSRVSANLQMHRQIPVALGQADAEHKAAALVHKFRVEAVDSEHLRGILSRARSATVDMGVETTVVNMKGVTFSDLLMKCQHDDEGFLPESDVYDQAPSSLCTDNQALLPGCLLASGICHIIHNAVHEVCAQISVWEGGREPASGCPPERRELTEETGRLSDSVKEKQGSEGTTHSLRVTDMTLTSTLIEKKNFSLCVCVCALSIDCKVNQALQHWSTWLHQFEAVIGFLHASHCVERFTATCLHGTAYYHLASRFSALQSAHSRFVRNKPARWRWGSVVEALCDILPLARLLPVVWDPAKYSKGLALLASDNEDGGHGLLPGSKALKAPPQSATAFQAW